MAIIPYFEQSQSNIPQSRSAVGTDVERIQGEATEAFGKALFEQGVILNKQAKKLNDQLAEQEATAAEAAYKRTRQVKRQEVMQTDAVNDLTGVTAVKEVDAQSRTDREDLLATMTSAEARRRFAVKALQVEAEDAPKTLADSVQTGTAKLSAMFENNMAWLAQDAYSAPSQLAENVAKAQVMVRGSDLIAPNNKAQMEQVFTRNITKAAIRSYTDQNKYTDAKRVAALSRRTLGEEEGNKIMQEIQQEENRYWNTLNTMEQQFNTKMDRQRSDAREQFSALIQSRVEIAGNDPVEQARVNVEIMDLQQSDPVTFTQSWAKQMIEAKSETGAIADENYKTLFYDEFLSKPRKSYKAAYGQINKDYDDRIISGKTALELQKLVKQAEDDGSRDPAVLAYRQEAIKNVEAQVLSKYNSWEYQLNKNKIDGEARREVMKYLSGVSRVNGGKPTIEQEVAYAKNYATSNSFKIESAAPQSGPGALDTPQNIKTKLDKAYKDVIKSKVEGRSTTDIKAKIDNLKQLQRQYNEANRIQNRKVK